MSANLAGRAAAHLAAQLQHNFFGTDASARDTKNGAAAEAGRREDVAMEAIANSGGQGHRPASPGADLLGSVAADRARELLSALLRRYQQEGPYSLELEVTPELAAFLLTRNENNRTPKRKIIDDIAADIRSGRWLVNGETIILSPEGLVNDGQHRLEAVIIANIAIRTFVAFGLSRATRQTVDSTQTTRTPGDFIAMKGIDSGNHVAAVAGYLWQVRRFGALPLNTHTGTARPTKRELDQFAVENLSVIQAALAAVPGNGSQKIASRALLALVYLLLRDKDEPAARAFIVKMISGADLPATSPLYSVRERLIEDKRRRLFNPRDGVELLLRAWNAHRSGRRLSKVVSNGQWPVIAR